MNNRLFPEEFARSDSVIQMTDRRVAPEETNLSQFFEQIGAIKVELGEVSQLLRKLQEANEESKGISSAVAMKALRDRMDADISLVTKIARSLKVKLQELERANTENRKIKWCEEGTATDRTRVTMTSNQRTKLKELMDDFSSLRQKMTGEYKETIERRCAPFLITVLSFQCAIGPSLTFFSICCAILHNGLRLLLEFYFHMNHLRGLSISTCIVLRFFSEAQQGVVVSSTIRIVGNIRTRVYLDCRSLPRSAP